MATENQLSLFDSPSQSFKTLSVFRSSAGSGKTFTLVKEYLKIILKNPDDFKHVLAVTFTNKAAEEMKSRILTELGDIASEKASNMSEAILKDFSREGINLDMKKRADRALKNLLHNYSRFEVGTIDYFFTRLVRALAKEFKLPLRYDIDVDNEKAVEMAVEKLFDMVGGSPDLRSWMEEFMLSQLEEDKGWNVDRNIMDLGMELFKEKFQTHLAGKEIDRKELGELIHQLQKTRSDFRDTLRSFAGQALKLINSKGLKSTDFKWGGSGTVSVFKKFMDNQFDLGSRFIKVAKGEDDWVKDDSIKRPQIEELAREGLSGIASDIYEFYSQFHPSYVTAEELLRNIYAYGLLSLINEKLIEYRTENNLLLLDDIHFLLRKLIGDEEENPAPFMYEKMGSRFKHILIDEFQDTSNFQWNNLLPLIVNSLSNNFRVMLAGDAKQSIYRWRGGNLSLLLEGVKTDLAPFEDRMEEVPLSLNWRSAKNIVEFNNSFFSKASSLLKTIPDLPLGQTLTEEAYKSVNQEFTKPEDGLVEVKFFEKEDDHEWREKAKDETVKTILAAREEGFAFKDFLILVGFSYQANEMAEKLSSHNIPIITQNSLSIENSPKVNFLISVIQWLKDPDNELARSGMVFHYQLAKGNQVEDYHRLFSSIKGDHFPYGIFPGVEPEQILACSGKPVNELVEELTILFGLNSPPDPFLQRLQEICLELSTQRINDLSQFLLWWEREKQKKESEKRLGIVLPEQFDAVNIMTIHKAKGLQRPIVIIPFASYSFKPIASTFWTEEVPPKFRSFGILPLNFSSKLKESVFEDAYRKEFLENMLDWFNVSYVAFTRPQKRLYVYSERFHPDRKGIEQEKVYMLNKLLYVVFESPDFGFRENWDPVNWHFRLGDPVRSDEKEEPSKAKEVILSEFPSQTYAGKVRLRPEANRFFLLFDNEKAEKIRTGVKIHAVLEQLENQESLNEVIKMLSAQGILNYSEEDRIRERVLKLFEMPQFKNWFGADWEAMNEREIIHQGRILKPDRVLMKGKEAIVIDYKSESHQPAHQKQVTEYASLLKEMGYTDIRKYLVYTEEGEVVEVK